MLLADLVVEDDVFAKRTGWAVKPEGACKGEACVPLPESARTSDGRLDLQVVADRLGMPLVADEGAHLWALGPETGVTGRALTTAVAPDLTLPDIDGKSFSLSSLRGRKVVMVAWASW
jgi:hypothetical protein